MYGIYNSILLLPLLMLPLLCWVTGFLPRLRSPFQPRFEEGYDMERVCHSGLAARFDDDDDWKGARNAQRHRQLLVTV
jgi:hypothetical protein